MPEKPVHPPVPNRPEAPAPKPASRGLAGNAGRFGFLTMVSRVLGLVREQLFAALVGASWYADAFVVAFRIPNLLRDLFAEGALSAAFVPTFTERLKNGAPGEAWRLANRVMNTLCLLLGALVLAGMAFSPQLVALLASGFGPEPAALAADLTRVMLPFLPVVSLAAVAMGMLTSQGRFGPPALAPAAFNVASIAVGAALWFWGAEPRLAVTGWAAGTMLGGLCQFAVQLPSLRRAGWRWSPVADLRLRDEGLKRIARLMVPATIGLAATQVNIVVNTQFASAVPGAPAWLSYAFRLLYLPIGVFGVAVATVSTASVAHRAAERDQHGVDATLGEGLRLIAFLTLPSTAVLAVLGEPIIRLIYQYGRFHAEDTRQTALALACYSVGLYAYSAVKVVAPAFYALGISRAPVRASLAAVAANLALNAALFPLISRRFGAPAAGAALALGTSVAALANFGVLLRAFKGAGGDLAGQGIASHAVRVALASAAAAAGGWLALRAGEGWLGTAGPLQRLATTGAALAVTGAVYAVLCLWWRVDEVRSVVRAVRRRLARRASGTRQG